MVIAFIASYLVTILPSPSTTEAQSWLTGYDYRKTINITAASPDEQTGSWTTQVCAKDVMLSEFQPGTNQNANPIWIRTHPGAANYHSIFEFDVSAFTAPSGYTLSHAYFTLTYYSKGVNNPVGLPVDCHKLTRLG
jgi:hypothetical protein